MKMLLLIILLIPIFLFQLFIIADIISNSKTSKKSIRKRNNSYNIKRKSNIRMIK
ncbi:hypothetical protein [Dethiothermospora halolimnae]|uniref:hypothetical protein n=1 Tax=Dethiothermospora halolimnae TaxID=3114390 RepID=UPI003CCB903B